MAVDQLQQTESGRGLATSVGRPMNRRGVTEAMPEGRRRTLLFAAVLGAVILIGALGVLALFAGPTNPPMTRRWTVTSTESPRESTAT